MTVVGVISILIYNDDGLIISSIRCSKIDQIINDLHNTRIEMHCRTDEWKGGRRTIYTGGGGRKKERKDDVK